MRQKVARANSGSHGCVSILLACDDLLSVQIRLYQPYYQDLLLWFHTLYSFRVEWLSGHANLSVLRRSRVRVTITGYRPSLVIDHHPRTWIRSWFRTRFKSKDTHPWEPLLARATFCLMWGYEIPLRSTGKDEVLIHHCMRATIGSDHPGPFALCDSPDDNQY